MLQKPCYQLFLDLDGVLVDFDRGVQELLGQVPSSLPRSLMWSCLASTKDFFAKLSWMPDGKLLWESCQKWDPYILTGVPLGEWAIAQKKEWCQRELGHHVRVLTCLAPLKALTAKEFIASHCRGILVDDREAGRDPWEKAGGLFILHRSAEESLAQLNAIYEEL